MRQEMIHRPIRKRGIGVLAALAAAAAMVAAGPAQARNEFQNGFEDQLGRIAAVGAVNLGLSILTGGYYPAAVVPVPVRVKPPVVVPKAKARAPARAVTSIARVATCHSIAACRFNAVKALPPRIRLSTTKSTWNSSPALIRAPKLHPRCWPALTCCTSRKTPW